MNAAGAGLVHVGMSSAHPIAITAGTDGTLYLSGLADDPIEVITYKGAAWIDGLEGLIGNGPTARDAADVLRERFLNGICHPEAMLRLLSEAAQIKQQDESLSDSDRARASGEGQAFLAAARILFAAKQVAQHEAAEHTAQREAAYKAGRS